MKSSDDLPATQPPPPSVTVPTRTSEPDAPSDSVPALDPRTARGMQLRDPDRYQILGEHGRGGLGRVFRAYDRELGRDIAIKELLSRGHVHEVRFLSEALITARLEHPGIVPLHEAGRWPDGTPFYAMKLVSGRPLRDLIAERTTVEQRIELLHHVIAVADAIAYAHGRNIIHRDLKPSNVIVGDFGETVVIDWGLAKDVSFTDESTKDGSLARGSGNDGVTVTGSVLGTPAYMAPEQERGERVDQRADVFAIGAMLWELCSLQRVPPASVGTRDRMLRRAGIDKDLAIIIDKALDPNPERRYRDAGALAADLKAFKAGARIAARTYSLPALLTHWIRRHRVFAISATAALAVLVAGVTLHVFSIAIERDRADIAANAAKGARAAAEDSLNSLTLTHAQLLLTTDPSAAIDVLASYKGADETRAAQIRAEATGRGVALVRAAPHTNNIFWLRATPDNAILSLSSDGTIARTDFEGHSTIVARDVSESGLHSYSSSRTLLAYACAPTNICLFDLQRNAELPTSEAPLNNLLVSGLSFSPSGKRLAVMTHDATLRVFDVSDISRPNLTLIRQINNGNDVTFLDEDIIVAGRTDGLEFIRPGGDSRFFSVRDNSFWDANAIGHEFVVATIHGDAFAFQGAALNPAHIELCHGPVSDIKFVPKQPTVAYACRDGMFGLWDPKHGTVTHLLMLDGHADRIAVSEKGDYLIVSAGTGTVTVFDLSTSLSHSYKGHEFRVMSLAPPTLQHDYVISADSHGNVRAWPVAPRIAKVAVVLPVPVQHALFTTSSVIVATSNLAVLTVLSSSKPTRSIEPHEGANYWLQKSNTGTKFVTTGLRDLIEVWSTETLMREHFFSTGQGSVSQLRFLGERDDFLTSGRDGRLIHWTISGSATVVARFVQPIDNFTVVDAASTVVLATEDGALWRIEQDGSKARLRSPGSPVTKMLTLPDHKAVYIGFANGDVITLDTTSWRYSTLMRTGAQVVDIAAANDSCSIAIASDDGTINVARRCGPAPTRWTILPGHARGLVFTPDGILVAACTTGAIWFYLPATQRWIYQTIGVVGAGAPVLAPDGTTVITCDREGRVIEFDLELVRLQLQSPPKQGQVYENSKQ